MNILVLGGSYFVGKHFIKMAVKEHNITVFNRGNKLLGLPQVSEIHGDRHDNEAIGFFKGRHFDAIVDFCAYNEGDIAAFFQIPEFDFSQYIYVSTCDVYERGLNKLLDEAAPFERRRFGGVAGDYISGKVALEEELVEYAKRYDVNYTSIRPAFIYGPDNYAPRESIYFHWIENAGQILQPSDATGEFQMVYVDDVALAVLKAVGNHQALNQAYNLAPLPMETYDSFLAALEESVDTEFEKVPVTVCQIEEKNIPLPFPLTKEESNWYDGRKALDLIDNYTGLSDGLRRTFYSSIE